MSRQKIVSIVGVALIIILVIVAFSFKGKYDDASSLLVAAQADAADQKKASDAEIDTLKQELEALQAEIDEAKASIEEVTAEKEAAEKNAADLEAAQKAAKEASEKLESLSAKLTETEGKLTTAQNELAKQHDTVAVLQSEKAEAEAQLKQTKAELEAAEAALKTSEEELEKLTAEEVEYVRYDSECGVSFVMPEGAQIGSESTRMVEILLTDETSIKLSVSSGRINVMWYGADTDAVNALIATLQLN